VWPQCRPRHVDPTKWPSGHGIEDDRAKQLVCRDMIVNMALR